MRERVGGWLVAHLALVFAFLYLPILVVVVLSFNASGQAIAWGGFSTEWYPALLDNAQITRGLRNTIVVAVGTTVFSLVLGTLLAVGLERYNRSAAVEAGVLSPAVFPDIVLAIGLLAFFTLIRFTLGLQSILLAHVLFGTAFATAVIRTRLHNLDRSTEEASMDLGATQVGTFLRVTLPALTPGIVAAGLLTFTLSMDEFVLAFFTQGPTDPTLPIVIYSMVRFGVTPDVNALATLLMAISLVVVLLSQRLGKVTDAL